MAIPILLGHNDALLRLERSGDLESFFTGQDSGAVDLPRSSLGGVAGGFFACWIPRDLFEPDPDEETVVDEDGGYETSLASPLDPEHARELTLSMMDKLYGLEEASAGCLQIVRSSQDLVRCLQDDIFATILHFEGAEALDEDLEDLEEFYEHGLRSLGIVWSRPNLFGHGVPFRFPSWPDTGPGLTLAGFELVRACNDLGILLDVSHLNAAGFWDVARCSRAPLVASHSNAHALCPSSRNLTDDQLQAIADSGGLVGINFCVSDLRPDGEEDPDTPLELILDHIEYIAETIGLEHVALGSDYDGATVPDEVADASELGRVMEGLQDRGYTQEDLEMVAHGNWLRVVQDTWN